MIFWVALFGIVAAFCVAFYIVKSGRLTMYLLGLDVALINAEPIFNAAVGYDFTAIMTAREQGWLILVCTALAAVARKRRDIQASMKAVGGGG